jgi:hypothetical protein
LTSDCLTLSQPINRLVLRAGSSDWQDETLALVSLAPFDSAGTKYVQRDIEVITLLRPITLGLLAIAAVITPLGLYETIEPAEALRPVSFVRQSDEGSFGLVTPHRPYLGSSRDCTDREACCMASGWKKAQ